MNEERFLLIPLLALVGTIPALLLVASVQRTTLASACRGAVHFLGTWGGKARGRGTSLAMLSLGVVSLFAVLAGLAAFLNERGDDALPKISETYGHFGKKDTAWAVSHEEEWREFKNRFRTQWTLVHPAEDLRHDRAAWANWKNDHGRNLVRAARVLALYAVFVLIAGLVDLRSAAFRKRGGVLFAIGIFSFMLFSYLWADQHGRYVREVFAANSMLGGKRAEVPASREFRPSR